MAHFKSRYWLNFDATRATQPLIHDMSKKFEVIFNIRQATVGEKVGLIAMELEGDREQVKGAVEWLEQNGVSVEPVEINTIEG